MTSMCIYHIDIYIYNYCSISNDPKCPIGRAYIETVMDEKITLCEYTTQSFMFYLFVTYTFLFYFKSVTDFVVTGHKNQSIFWMLQFL